MGNGQAKSNGPDEIDGKIKPSSATSLRASKGSIGVQRSTSAPMLRKDKKPLVHKPISNESFKQNMLDRLTTATEHQFQETLQALENQLSEVMAIDYKEYLYPFENVVFEGGGAKGQVYVGCLEVLEEIGVKPKRLAGSSAGAICAALVAVGYSNAEMSAILKSDLSAILIDHSCGLFSLLPNLIRQFGWNPGKRMYEYMGTLLEDKTGNKDITFIEVYEIFGKELCITAVNLNMMSVEYFHPKTSPHMPVRLAVRMSVSIPGIFQAVRIPNPQGDVDVYIDGGLLCNYPIHAFDGWWLSMKPEDSFLNRIQPLSQISKLMDKKVRFGTFNEKTVGFLVYSSLEQDVMQTELESRVGLKITKRPDTKLYRSRKAIMESKNQALAEHEIFLNALDRFMRALSKQSKAKVEDSALKKVNAEGSTGLMDDYIDREELRKVMEAARAVGSAASLEHNAFSAGDIEILFGARRTTEEIFQLLDADSSGRINYQELLKFIELSGIDIQAKFQGYERKELKSIGDFAIGLQDCLLTNLKRVFIEENDIDRTVGVNTDYIQTTDFRTEEEDHLFMVEQGRRATISFLKHYVHSKQPARKGSPAERGHDIQETAEEEPTNESEQESSSKPLLVKSASSNDVKITPESSSQ